MRKTLIASVMMLICTLAAMATSPSSQGGKAMSPFKFKDEQPQNLPGNQMDPNTFEMLDEIDGTILSVTSTV